MGKAEFNGVGAALRSLRQSRRISQLGLALAAGVSQRHLSYVETGRAQPSRELLLALLHELGAPLATHNELLMLAGYAPMYTQRPLASTDMAPVRNALTQLLQAHEPSPALVLDASWNLIEVNRGAQCLLRLLLGDEAMAALMQNASTEPPNMLRLLFSPSGLRRLILNFEECTQPLLQHVQQSLFDHPELAAVLDEIKPWLPKGRGDSHFPHARPPAMTAPVLNTRLVSPHGELRFFSMLTTFGTPQDITAASLRVEHMFAADDTTKAVVESWRSG
jgi:transcriptional regulator with XRE-family HTH domain